MLSRPPAADRRLAGAGAGSVGVKVLAVASAGGYIGAGVVERLAVLIVEAGRSAEAAGSGVRESRSDGGDAKDEGGEEVADKHRVGS